MARNDELLRSVDALSVKNREIQQMLVNKIRETDNWNRDNEVEREDLKKRLEEMEKLHAQGYSQINLLRNTVSSPHYVSDFFTVKSAYEFIINNCPSSLNRSLLQACDINNYLIENVSYDTEMSDRVKQELLQSVPISSGVVQAGERIVDRGEIIDSQTYNVLRSLKKVYESKSGGNQRHHLMLAGQIILVSVLSSATGCISGHSVSSSCITGGMHFS